MLYMQSELLSLLETDLVEDVRMVAQAAIELEHATMPPYLYAMYSLGTSNPNIRNTLLSIVEEEMLHMLLTCNLLNAIGGVPKIHDPTFVPSYPTHLPGTVNGGLVVPLRAFSKQVCQDVFMEIEEPESPLSFPVRSFAAGLAPSATIGVFYARLKASLKAEYFTGDAARQVTCPLFELAESEQKIVDLPSACKAIDYIVKQGEGTSEEPFDTPSELAHYYRFAEIVKGYKLIPNPSATPSTPPNQRYIYGGDPISIDPGIIPVLDSPKTSNYSSGSPARSKSDDFNLAYTGMLATLQSAFDGTPGDLDSAIDTMKYELRPLAKDLMQISVGNGLYAGPTFEYLV